MRESAVGNTEAGREFPTAPKKAATTGANSTAIRFNQMSRDK